ncbi:sulfurtransferase TusA family protein [Rhizorhabdus wittichii]|uniref:Sulfurtransferase TusA family protein n=1 Tax=Rhizorhabdus wittichii TaxID=160791 RepID=A0A975CZP6_9SPHN|nr:sulfurtransferase TusA family protein [Rhizorhabdus wittichii]ARR53715.1 redox protein [Rhizorhabdus wittichii DC-6]QTH20029.1 sulfurtransferase TusA family protein [Rhizorhabdus wittichii]
MPPLRLDARGMRCPWPVVRLARAIRDGAEAVLILADDPIAPGEIAALAAQRGWSVAPAAEPAAWIVSAPVGS